jgi:hypothetical protein
MHPNNLQQLHLTTYSSVAVTEGGAPVTIDPTAAAASVASAAASGRRPATKSRRATSDNFNYADDHCNDARHGRCV